MAEWQTDLNSDVFLLNLIDQVTAESGVAEQGRMAMVTAVSVAGYENVAQVCAFHGGALQSMPINPLVAIALISELESYGMTAALSGMNAPPRNLYIFQFMNACVRAYKAENPDPVGAAIYGADIAYPVATHDDIYRGVLDFANINVPLSKRFAFVKEARKSLRDFGYVQSLPDFAAATYISGGTGKRKTVELGDGAAEFTLGAADTAVPMADMQQARIRATDFMDAVLAVYSVVLAEEAFEANRDYGWQLVPGYAQHMRVMLTAAELQKLRVRVVALDCDDPAVFGRLIDRIFRAFLDYCAEGSQHPARVIERILEDRYGLFETAVDDLSCVSHGSLQSSASHSTKPVVDAAAAPTKGICPSWWKGGACTGGDSCPFVHDQTARSGQSSRGGGGGKGGYSHGYFDGYNPQWQTPPNWGGNWQQNWEQQTPHAQWYPPAKGKGKGGKGKGGGKGGGKGHAWGKQKMWKH